MTQTPMHPKYRCPDGHEFFSTGSLDLTPEMLPCPTPDKETKEACGKAAKVVDGPGAHP